MCLWFGLYCGVWCNVPVTQATGLGKGGMDGRMGIVQQVVAGV